VDTQSTLKSSQARHPFGELLAQYRARKLGLTQTRLAELAGYDQSVLVRMAQGKKDLTGPSGRERVVRLIETLADQSALTTLDEANGLLLAADMPPLFERQPIEARLIERLTRLQPGHRMRRTNLPAPLTSFVGRAQEIADARRLLNTTRLLTLTGAGGCGKTRLAQRVAADVLLLYSEGVWYAELAALTDPALIADAVVHALGLVASDRPALDQLCDTLRERHVLLVLDNCEHLVEAAVEFAVVVLRACPRVTILTTSREALNVEGETAWRVPPMQPDEAGRLFVDRAAAARSDVTLSAQDTTVAHICQRLDGMPLAIELAAARLNTLSLNDVAARLDDRFNLLTAGRRGALPRHQTLRALIDWSYDTLSEEEKVVFRRLGVFVGGWELEQAEQVVSDDTIHQSDVDAWLTQLVSKSLVAVDDLHGATRYRLLETIREYALERLTEKGELASACMKHAEAFVTLAQRAEPHMHDSEQTYWVPRLERDHDNIRAALSRSLSPDGDVQTGIRLASRMWQFWWVGHIVEGVAWLSKLLDAAEANGQEAPAFVLGRAWLGYGSLLPHMEVGGEVVAPALQNALRLLEEAGDEEGIAFALYIYGSWHEHRSDDRVAKLLKDGYAFERWRGNRLGLEWAVYLCARHNWNHDFPDLTHRIKFTEDAIKAASLRGDFQTFAHASFDLAMLEDWVTNSDEARKRLEQALEAARVIGACWEESIALRYMGQLLCWIGDADGAQDSVSQWFELAERYGWPDVYKVHSYCILGQLARDSGDYTLAREHYLKSIEVAGKQATWPISLDGLSCVVSAQGNHVLAARLLGMSAQLREWGDEPRGEIYRRDLEPYHAQARAALGDEAYEAAYAEGRAVTLEQALDYALNETMETMSRG
jgi:predicted ATPase